MALKNVRPVTVIHADKPANFHINVGGLMPYSEEGDSVLITRDDLVQCEPAFLKTLLYADLQQAFSQYPDLHQLILQPA